MATGKTIKRPIAITIIAWLYVAVGAIGLALHIEQFKAHPPGLHEAVPFGLLAVAIIAGIFMLRGSNWARWLALAWIAIHVAISAFHPWRELVVHCLLLVMIGFLLLEREARDYFTASRTAA